MEILMKQIESAIKEGFKGWEYCTAKNGDIFAMDCNIESNIHYFVYKSRDGSLYESTELPKHRMDLSGAPVAMSGVITFAEIASNHTN